MKQIPELVTYELQEERIQKLKEGIRRKIFPGLKADNPLFVHIIETMEIAIIQDGSIDDFEHFVDAITNLKKAFEDLPDVVDYIQKHTRDNLKRWMNNWQQLFIYIDGGDVGRMLLDYIKADNEFLTEPEFQELENKYLLEKLN